MTLASSQPSAEGVVLRLAQVEDSAAIARVHVDAWRTAYVGILSDEFLASLSYARREEQWRALLAQPKENEFTLVAEAESGGVVGFAHGGPERSDMGTDWGEVYALYLLQEYRRHGIGRQLMRAAAQRLQLAGFRSLLVWVLRENPARHFYARLGGMPFREQDIDIGPHRLVEVAYVWEDIAALTV